MAIGSFLTQAMTQTIVYWGSPTPDGMGTKTYADPVEIKGRWQSRVELIDRVGSRLGETVVSRAQIFLLQDVDEMGYLYLGDLDDLDSDEEGDPTSVDGAYEIKRFDKSPVLRSTTQFIRKAYV